VASSSSSSHSSCCRLRRDSEALTARFIAAECPRCRPFPWLQAASTTCHSNSCCCNRRQHQQQPLTVGNGLPAALPRIYSTRPSSHNAFIILSLNNAVAAPTLLCKETVNKGISAAAVRQCHAPPPTTTLSVILTIISCLETDRNGVDTKFGQCTENWSDFKRQLSSTSFQVSDKIFDACFVLLYIHLLVD